MLEQIKIILINTTHSGNVGAVARAMKNMGLSKLCLVAPKAVLGEEAYARASGAEDILDAAIVATSLEAALAGTHRVYGLSGRLRTMAWPILPIRNGAVEIVNALKTDATLQIALLFGCEQSGLSNEALEKCHYQITIPADPVYASLNLAQAVQIAAYELRMAWLEGGQRLAVVHSEEQMERATSEEIGSYFQHLEETLTEIQFLDPNKPGFLMRHLRRLYHKSDLTKVELNILRGMLRSIQKYKRVMT